jgi:hypothetical protein
LECSGFVQIDNTWVLGGAFDRYTTLAENSNIEYEVAIYVEFDAQIPGWALVIDNTVVGYWPSIIYNTLQTRADSVQFDNIVLDVTNLYCYTLLIEKEAPSNEWASFFFFGGPGALNPAGVS